MENPPPTLSSPPNIVGARSVAYMDGDRTARQDSDAGYAAGYGPAFDSPPPTLSARPKSVRVPPLDRSATELSAAGRWFLETRPYAAEEVQMKVKNRKSFGRILLKGDNITLVQQVGDGGGATD